MILAGDCGRLDAVNLKTLGVVTLLNDEALDDIMDSSKYFISSILRFAMFSNSHAYFYYYNVAYRIEYHTSKLESLFNARISGAMQLEINKKATYEEEVLSAVESFSFYYWVKKKQIVYLTSLRKACSIGCARRISEKIDGTCTVSDRISFPLSRPGHKNKTRVLQLRNQLLFYYNLPKLGLVADLLCLKSLKFVSGYTHGKISVCDFWTRKPPVLVFSKIEYILIDWIFSGPAKTKLTNIRFLAIKNEKFHPMIVKSKADFYQFDIINSSAILNSTSIIAIANKGLTNKYHEVRLKFTA